MLTTPEARDIIMRGCGERAIRIFPEAERQRLVEPLVTARRAVRDARGAAPRGSRPR